MMHKEIYLKEAEEIAQKKIQELSEFSNLELTIMNDATIEFEYGWMFFYQSEEYVRTGDESKLIGGNAPLIVDKFLSKLYVTGTRMGEEFYIEKYCELRESPEEFEKEISA